MTGERGKRGRGDVGRRLVLTSAAAPLLLSGFTQARPGTPRILTYSDHASLGGMRTRFLRHVVFPAVERESNGRLKIEAHWNGEVAGSFDALRAVGEGVATDMATVVGEYTPGQLPLHQIFKSFPLGPTGSRQVEFLRRVYAEVPAFSAELERNNVVEVFLGTGHPTAFFSTRPLPGLDGLRGGKWRSSSFWHRGFLTNAGATPMTTPWGPGTLDDLRAGRLDGVMVNVDDGFLINIQEAAPHVLIAQDLWMGHTYPVVMNKTVWNGLPRADRAAVRRAAAQSYRTLGPVMDAGFDTQLEALRKGGANVRILDADELARWRITTKYAELQATWVEEQRGNGVEDAGSALKSVTRIMDRFAAYG